MNYYTDEHDINHSLFGKYVSTNLGFFNFLEGGGHYPKITIGDKYGLKNFTWRL